jgi:hypothetical protein
VLLIQGIFKYMQKNLYIAILIIFLTPVSSRAQQPSVYQIKRMPFSTGPYSEISPVIVNDGIVFCSDRRTTGIRYRTTFEGQRLYNIFIVEKKDTSKWGKPEEIKSERSFLFNSGPLCFAPDGKTVYFTSDVETGKITKKKDFINHSGIFIGDLSGTILSGVRPFLYNNAQYDIGHPSVSEDGKYLFFASDMPGGQGGSDIYYCEWINGQWSQPVNLGPKVNSSASENYPYMHPSGRLYFSSNRPGGKGRMDVYYTVLTLGSWETPSLMPEPINSPSDDFAFVADENLQEGYFASNRGISDDIYEFTSTIIRKSSCDTLVENNYCYEFLEENAVKWDTLPFRYEWKFGDGDRGIGSTVEHCYRGPGQYLVQLDVVNLITKEIMYNEKTYNLVVTDVEQPYISCPDQGTIGQRMRLSADSTNLPGWNIDRYYWNFGDETIGIGKEVDKAYSRPGTYNIQLIVSTVPEPGGVAREACVCKNITIVSLPQN